MATSILDRFRRRAAGAAGIGDWLGGIPHRLALAGGWIDQPFVSS